MTLLLVFVIALVLGGVLTPLIARIAKKEGILDAPDPERKLHTSPTPLLGGLAVFLSVAITMLGLLAVELITGRFGITVCESNEHFLTCNDPRAYIIIGGIFVAGVILVMGGILDDKYKLSPKYQFLFPVLAALTVILAGVGNDNLTNPFYALGLSENPLIRFSQYHFSIFGLEFTLWTDVFTFVWLLIMMYATKFLDGLNGLVSGMSVIGATILFVTSMVLGQSLGVFLALIIAGAFLGFLPYNFKGKIFLGESGSTLAGFLLGTLALIGPAKISITLLVLGIPILDVLWVVFERIFRAKKSPFRGDLRHLHFKLLRGGFSSRAAVITLWLVALFFGLAGLQFQGGGHGVLLFGLIIVMILFLYLTRKKKYGNM